MANERNLIHIPIEQGNPRRYGKPWAGRVKLMSPTRTDLEWGDYIEESPNSYVTVYANSGDLIYYGCKDNRKPDRSIRQFAVIDDLGMPLEVTRHEALLIAAHEINP